VTTALQIVDGAAEHIGVKTAEISLESFEFQLILDNMNDLLEEWNESGLTPAFVSVENSTDTVDIPRSGVAAAKYELAIRIAPAFQKVVSQALVLNATKSLQRLQAAQVFIGQVAYPDTLPTGSGNDCSDVSVDRRFYPQNTKENF